METSALAVLDALKRRDDRAWSRLAQVYTPVVHYWFRRAHVPRSDADDLCQEVLSVVCRRIDEFDPEGSSFRGWLWGISRFVVRAYRRQYRRRPFCRTPEQLERYPFNEPVEPEPDYPSSYWRTVNRLRWHFEETTWEAFWLVVVEDHSPAQVAEELGLNVSSVHQAKSRVLKRLREEFHAEVPEKGPSHEPARPETPNL
jgi:RNA polymerase sigma-70 factor (ECF subfamily)